MQLHLQNYPTSKELDITIFPACFVPISGWLFPPCVMKTWILPKVAGTFAALRVRFGGKVLGLYLIFHLPSGWQNDSLIKVSCFLNVLCKIWLCDLSLLIHRCLSVVCMVFLNYRKIPKISPRAYIFQRPFLKGLFLEGLIFGGAYGIRLFDNIVWSQCMTGIW